MTVGAFVKRSAWRGGKRALRQFSLVVAVFATGGPATAPAWAVDCAVDVSAAECAVTSSAIPAAKSNYNDVKLIQDVGIDNSRPWIGQNQPSSNIAPPVSVSPTDTGFSARTSASSWRDYHAKQIEMQVDQSKARAPKDLKLPKTPTFAPNPLDVWTSMEVQGVSGAADQATRAGVGADYKFNPKTTFGVSAEAGDSRAQTGIGGSEDQKASAYVTYKPAPVLSVETRTQWESTSAYSADGLTRGEKGSVTVAPKISKPFALDGGQTFEPFVTYKREFDMISTGDAAGGNTAGAGVTFAKPDSYSLSVTTDVEHLGVTEPTSLSSKMQLKLPLP